MSRYTGPSCRLCRREGTKLFLKGTKCLTEKCPVERRAVSARPARPDAAAAGARRRSTPSSCVRSRRSSASTACREQPVPQHVRAGDAASPASRAPTCSSRSRAGSTTSCTAWASPASRKAARQLIAPRPRRSERPAGSTSRPTGSRPGEEVRVAPGQPRAGVRQAGAGIRRRAARRCRGSSVDTDKAAGRMLERPTRDAHPDRRPGTAHRRALLEVTMTHRSDRVGPSAPRRNDEAGRQPQRRRVPPPAARARLRLHARQLAAPPAALVAPRQRRLGLPPRRRGARAPDHAGRARGRAPDHAAPQGADARRSPKTSTRRCCTSSATAPGRSTPATSRSTARSRIEEPRPPAVHAPGRPRGQHASCT